jgi:crooked neck
MEKRYKEIERARAIYGRFVSIHPEPKNWLKWARFEEEQNDLGMAGIERGGGAAGDTWPKMDPVANIFFFSFFFFFALLEKAREIYSQAIEFLGEEHIDQKVLVAFAKFEIKLKEVSHKHSCRK